MALSIGQLIAEKERLQAVVDQAGEARAEIGRIDKALELLGVEIPGGKLSGRGGRASSGPLACEHCDKSYSQPASLWSHLRKVHGIRPSTDEGGLPCDVGGCDYIAKNKAGLSAHKRMAHKAAAA